MAKNSYYLDWQDFSAGRIRRFCDATDSGSDVSDPGDIGDISTAPSPA